MSKYQEIKQVILKMVNKQEPPAQRGAEIDDDENESMTEGRKPRVFGINRKITYFLTGVALVGFMIGMFNGVFSQKQEETKKPVKEDEPAALVRSPISEAMPAGYDEAMRLAAYEAQKTGRVAEPKNATRPAHVNESAYIPAEASNLQPDAATQPYPSVYYPAYPQLPPYYPGQPIQPAQVNVEEKGEKQRSPIKVALTGIGDGQAASAGNGGPTSAATPTGGYSYTAASPNTLQAGTLIPAVLISGINSDIGGQAVAQVQSDVYDSLFGRTLMIPAGSRMIGQYNAGAVVGQNRINISWNQLILPDGGAYTLGNVAVAVDGAGYAGLPGKVDNHSGKVLGGAAATSALAALGSIAAGNTGDTETYTAGQLAAQGAMSNLLNTASTMMQKNINIAPTITIEPGYPFNVFLSQPLTLQPY